MALYISNRQVMTGQTLSPSFVPTLLEAKYGLKHRVFSPPFKFSKLLLDSYEISNRKDQEIKYPVVPTGCDAHIYARSTRPWRSDGMQYRIKRTSRATQNDRLLCALTCRSISFLFSYRC